LTPSVRHISELTGGLGMDASCPHSNDPYKLTREESLHQPDRQISGKLLSENFAQ
jgi:hypothetical protein